jgi:hypothetical protein
LDGPAPETEAASVSKPESEAATTENPPSHDQQQPA